MTDVFYPGPVHVAYSPVDPFDIGEPRTFAEDDVTFLTVPSWGEMDRLANIERAAREVAEGWFGHGDTNERLFKLTPAMLVLRAALDGESDTDDR